MVGIIINFTKKIRTPYKRMFYIFWNEIKFLENMNFDMDLDVVVLSRLLKVISDPVLLGVFCWRGSYENPYLVA